MYNINNTEGFDLSVMLIIGAFKLKNKALVESCEKTLMSLLGSEYTTDVVTVALFQLAKTDPETFQWTLQNLYTLNTCLDFIEKTVMFSVKKLMDKGFILGQDFSISHLGEILITQEAKAALIDTVSAPDLLLFEEILQVPSQEN